MNREDYIRLLDKENGQCTCIGLEALFEKKNEGLTLQALCDSIAERQGQSEALSGMPDRGIVREREYALRQFKETVGEYYDLLSTLASKEKIKFKSHNYRYPDKARDLTYKESIEFLKRSDAILTLHCGSCDQQIDIARNY